MKLLKILLLAISLGFGAVSYAQTLPPVESITDKQIESFLKEVESRGLTEQQLEVLAKTRGYTDADIIKLRERINRVKSGVSKTTETSKSSVVREQLEEVAQRTEVQVSASKDTTKVELYGQSLFRNKFLNFEPNLRIATPPDYIIGVDDELSVDVSGYASGHYNLKVSPEGTVKMEHFAPIYVNGLTVSQAKAKISQRLGSIYAGLNNGSLSLDLTLSKVRSIKVTVVGEVLNPGTYTVSSLATLFNALYQSGGPTEIGSFRNIKLIRSNRIIQGLDIYEFLQKGLLSNDALLNDRDVILVPVSETLVKVTGEVRRPLKYELKSGEGLEALLNYAGGFTENAYTRTLTLKRKNTKELEITNLDLDKDRNFLLKNGDELTVNAILDRFTNRVEVIGAVFRQGEFAIGPDLQTVGQLIAKAEGLREDAFKGRALLKRKRENLDPEFIALNLEKILRGEDMALKREDVLIVRSVTELREIRKVTIGGEVNQPGEYDFSNNVSVADLIFLAGGFREGATHRRIEVARRLYNDEYNESTVEVFNLDLENGLQADAGAFILKPYDQVYVRSLANYRPQQAVIIAGEVNYPSHYVIQSKTERISDLIERAGGLRKEAYIRGAQFFRDSSQVALDLAKVLKEKNSPNNLFLEEGDSLYIPKETQTVNLSGEVQNPTSVAYQPHFSFRDYISQAGGFTDSAHVKKTYVRYANGMTERTRSFLGIRFYPKVEKGMEVYVPQKYRDKISRAEIITMSTAVTSMVVVLLTLIRSL